MDSKPGNRNSAVNFLLQSSQRRRMVVRTQIELFLKLKEENVSVLKTLKGSL